MDSVCGVVDNVPKAWAGEVVSSSVTGLWAAQDTPKPVEFRHAVGSEPAVANGANPLQSDVLSLLNEGGADVVKVRVWVSKIDVVDIAKAACDVVEDGERMKVKGEGRSEETLGGWFAGWVHFVIERGVGEVILYDGTCVGESGER